MQAERILGIYAHPDDADMGAGGTLASLARTGAEVHLVVVTSGDAGGYDPEVHDDIVSIRQKEQRAAARELGVAGVTFLEGHADGDVRVEQPLIREIVEQIRIHRPERIFTMSPERNWNSVAASHPDHRAVGEAVVRAVYPAARNPFAFPELLEEGLEPWTVQSVWLQGHPENNEYVELTGEDLERKILAVRRHVSQFQDLDILEAYVRRAAAEKAAEAGLAAGSIAEGFFRAPTA